MIELCAAGRAGTDEVGNVAALLMGPDGAFITGSDFLMDGGVTAAYWYGDFAQNSHCDIERRLIVGSAECRKADRPNFRLGSRCGYG
jgi:hypothetical protein